MRERETTPLPSRNSGFCERAGDTCNFKVVHFGPVRFVGFFQVFGLFGKSKKKNSAIKMAKKFEGSLWVRIKLLFFYPTLFFFFWCQPKIAKIFDFYLFFQKIKKKLKKLN